MDYIINGEDLTEIADAIRSKTGGTDGLEVAEFAEEIQNITTSAEINLEKGEADYAVKQSRHPDSIPNYAYQRSSVALGGATQAGVTEEEYNASGKYKQIANDGETVLTYDQTFGFNFAQGDSTKARGRNAVALNRATQAEGKNSTALGDSTTANGMNSISSGYYTTADGKNSMTGGDHTQASGENSVALGDRSQATGKNSIAVGEGTQATENNKTVLGKWNQEVEGSLFEIGEGSHNGWRRNALTVTPSTAITKSLLPRADVAYNSNIGGADTTQWYNHVHARWFYPHSGININDKTTIDSTGKIKASAVESNKKPEYDTDVIRLTELKEHTHAFKDIEGISPIGTPEMYGAKGNGIDDDTGAVLLAIKNHKHVVAVGTYKVSEPIILCTSKYDGRDSQTFELKGKIIFKASDESKTQYLPDLTPVAVYDKNGNVSEFKADPTAPKIEYTYTHPFIWIYGENITLCGGGIIEGANPGGALIYLGQLPDENEQNLVFIPSPPVLSGLSGYNHVSAMNCTIKDITVCACSRNSDNEVVRETSTTGLDLRNYFVYFYGVYGNTIDNVHFKDTAVGINMVGDVNGNNISNIIMQTMPNPVNSTNYYAECMLRFDAVPLQKRVVLSKEITSDKKLVFTAIKDAVIKNGEITLENLSKNITLENLSGEDPLKNVSVPEGTQYIRVTNGTEEDTTDDTILYEAAITKKITLGTVQLNNETRIYAPKENNFNSCFYLRGENSPMILVTSKTANQMYYNCFSNMICEQFGETSAFIKIEDGAAPRNNTFTSVAYNVNQGYFWPGDAVGDTDGDGVVNKVNKNTKKLFYENTNRIFGMGLVYTPKMEAGTVSTELLSTPVVSIGGNGEVFEKVLKYSVGPRIYYSNLEKTAGGTIQETENTKKYSQKIKLFTIEDFITEKESKPFFHGGLLELTIREYSALHSNFKHSEHALITVERSNTAVNIADNIKFTYENEAGTTSSRIEIIGNAVYYVPGSGDESSNKLASFEKKPSIVINMKFTSYHTNAINFFKFPSGIDEDIIVEQELIN